MRITIILLFALVCFAFLPLAAQARQTPQYGWQADEQTRESAKHLKSEDVLFLAFGGEQLGEWTWGDTIEIKDAALISRFVSALKTAIEPAPPPPRPTLPGEPPDLSPGPYFDSWSHAHLDVYLKPGAKAVTMLSDADKKSSNLNHSNGSYGKDERGEFIRFIFDAHQGTSFGPRFISAIRAMGKYHVAQIRQRATESKSAIVAFRLCDGRMGIEDAKRQIDPAKIAQFLDALAQMDERAYQWEYKPRTASVVGRACVGEIELRDGKKIPLVLLLRQPSRDPKRDPEWLQILHEFGDANYQEPPPKKDVMP